MERGVICSECSHTITEPACMRCFLIEVVAWLDDQHMFNSTRKKIYQDLAALFKATKVLPLSSCCVLCRGKTNTICSYCMMKEIALITGEHISINSQEQLSETFNTSVYEYGLQRG